MLELECAVCGIKFKRRKCNIKSKHVFCSPKCSYKGRSLGLVKRIVIKSYNCKRKQKRICLVCGKKYIYSKTTQKYCSRKCFETAHHFNMLGNKNPSWTGGNSYNKRSYRGSNWKIQRKKCYERDNYICQECGVKCIGRKSYKGKNGNLLIQCHHIKKYESEEDNKINNLITLCARCHSIKHMRRNK